MRIIITGGTGLIGRALADSWSGDGHEIILLSRSPEHVAGLPEGTRAERWDCRTAAGWGALADGADAIVNLAGENLASGRWTAERKRTIRESRLDAGRAVVQAVKECSAKPRVIIQSSGVGYYGSCGDEPITEDTPASQGFLPEVSVEWEASTASVEASGVRRAIIRTSPVLSRTGGVLPRIVSPFRYFLGGPVGDGRQWLSWIHMADEVGAIRFLVEKEQASGPFNLAAPNPVTNGDFARLVGQTLGRPAAIRTPGAILRILFGEMATVLLDSQRVLPRRLLDLGFSFRFPELETALQDLLT